ncbi:high mobility group protein B2 [Plasmodium gaboni]|uniref:High mobility group protein B2 n=1 Tax=Plasmodium gaboni TaxID=647221 RepID=A0A151LNI0_9APIC|nr:high mobility group protein B2 [Plasmodium gaboni]XP_028537885.1 high mobility group protein B2 [Plasmodium sp. gorilla clade G2]SOV22260.1 high mobility group protein B2 [Plasmodium sp. DRC-Itaito]KYO00771.1 high mobility group protein B2 [Plasmodium gaboni]SOV13511.1 high mobility group protein B2 [Plasmodium gaboni]SOV13686.1 high mobility group protein B2 [Plasmodium sp. gorilla clade G2]
MASKSQKKVLKKQNKKKKKDPLAPKRALSAYMFYVKDKRLEIIKEKPELAKDVAQVGKLIGEAWGKLSPAQKAPYEKKAQLDKVRYSKEIEEYRKKNQE